MKYLLVCIGFISLGLGVIGVFLPVLPTTPFLLLTAYCFMKGSKRFNDWFVSTKIYKDYLENFIKTRSMTLKSKALILVYATFMIAAAAFFVNSTHVRIFLVILIAVKYYYFIFRIKTVPKQTFAVKADNRALR